MSTEDEAVILYSSWSRSISTSGSIEGCEGVLKCEDACVADVPSAVAVAAPHAAVLQQHLSHVRTFDETFR